MHFIEVELLRRGYADKKCKMRDDEDDNEDNDDDMTFRAVPLSETEAADCRKRNLFGSRCSLINRIATDACKRDKFYVDLH
jgi:hypothetical protein